MWALRPQYENKGSNKLCRDLEDQINCVAAYLCADGVFVIALDLSKAPLNPSHLSENCDLLSYRHHSSQTNLFILNPKIVSFNGLSGLEYSSQLTRGGGKETGERVSWIGFVFGDKEGARETVATQEISRKININLGRGS